MGASLPSAVTSTVVERQGSDAGIEGWPRLFAVGVVGRKIGLEIIEVGKM